ncbi:hypothetical protein [Burkholderia alba]|nr:hypothetical protein [Burkholderia alba]
MAVFDAVVNSIRLRPT